MKNHKKLDNISVNNIVPPDRVEATSVTVGNAGKDPFCVYAGMRHAVGSVIKNDDGSSSVCTKDGSWQNL